MRIAFRCYDVCEDQAIDKQEVTIVLKSIPILNEERYGISFNDENHNYDPVARTDFMI